MRSHGLQGGLVDCLSSDDAAGKRATARKKVGSFGQLLGAYLTILAMACAAIVGSLAEARAQQPTGAAGWDWNGTYYPTAREACRAQWLQYMNNGKSRFIGHNDTDNWWAKACSWTSYQYLCPEETGAGTGCGTVLPANVYFRCYSGYVRVAVEMCVPVQLAVPERCDPCGTNNGGATHPLVGNPVGLQTGTKLARATDFSTDDGRFLISRSYRSKQIGASDSAQGPVAGLGGSWAFDFALELHLGAFSGSPSSPFARLALVAPNGTAYEFHLLSSGQWVPRNSHGAS